MFILYMNIWAIDAWYTMFRDTASQESYSHHSTSYSTQGALGSRQLVRGCANHSFPERNADYQRFLVHNEPILNFLLPFLVINSGSLPEPEPPQHPAKQYSHLHQRQVLAHAVRRAVREGYESGRVVFSRGCALAEPSFRQECFWRIEVTRVPMDAVDMKGELRLLRDYPAHCKQRLMRIYLR